MVRAKQDTEDLAKEKKLKEINNFKKGENIVRMR